MRLAGDRRKSSSADAMTHPEKMAENVSPYWHHDSSAPVNAGSCPIKKHKSVASPSFTSSSPHSSSKKPITPSPQSSMPGAISRLASLSSPSSLPQPPRIIHGPWTSAEIERLKGLVKLSKDAEDGVPREHVDWAWVVRNFGDRRNRRQVLIKAVELGLRGKCVTDESQNEC